MEHMKCPDCGAKHFYVKDPEDQYNIAHLVLEQGIIKYVDPDADQIEVLADTEIFCDRCAWHSKLKTLKQAR